MHIFFARIIMYRTGTGIFGSSKSQQSPVASSEPELVQRTRLMTQRSRSEFDLVSTLGKVIIAQNWWMCAFGNLPYPQSVFFKLDETFPNFTISVYGSPCNFLSFCLMLSSFLLSLFLGIPSCLWDAHK